MNYKLIKALDEVKAIVSDIHLENKEHVQNIKYLKHALVKAQTKVNILKEEEKIAKKKGENLLIDSSSANNKSAEERLELAKNILKAHGVKYFCDKTQPIGKTTNRSIKPESNCPKQLHVILKRLADKTNIWPCTQRAWVCHFKKKDGWYFARYIFYTGK